MLLEIFVFRTNNQDCFDILQAIEFITNSVPAITIIAAKWRSQVIEESDNTCDTSNEASDKTKKCKNVREKLSGKVLTHQFEPQVAWLNCQFDC
jgi:hypothetical protein